MRINIFRPNFYNKDGTFNYESASKFLGMTQSDLYFSRNGNFSLINSNDLMSGVLASIKYTSKSPIFHSTWSMNTCYHSDEDLKFLRRLVRKPSEIPDWSTYDYFIMNSSGKILHSNCEISQTIDENGVFHLVSENQDLNLLVYPAKRRKYAYKHYFCYGKDFDDLNKHIAMMISSKRISVPKNFKNGFSKTTEYPLTNGYGYEKQ